MVLIKRLLGFPMLIVSLVLFYLSNFIVENPTSDFSSFALGLSLDIPIWLLNIGLILLAVSIVRLCISAAPSGVTHSRSSSKSDWSAGFDFDD